MIQMDTTYNNNEQKGCQNNSEL